MNDTNIFITGYWNSFTNNLYPYQTNITTILPGNTYICKDNKPIINNSCSTLKTSNNINSNYDTHIFYQLTLREPYVYETLATKYGNGPLKRLGTNLGT